MVHKVTKKDSNETNQETQNSVAENVVKETARKESRPRPDKNSRGTANGQKTDWVKKSDVERRKRKDKPNIIKLTKGQQMRLGATMIIALLLGAFLIYWEVGGGRIKATCAWVLVPKETIEMGDQVTASMLEPSLCNKTSIMEGALLPKDIDKIKHVVAKQYIPKGAQISKYYLAAQDQYIKKGQSIYKIPAEWINTRSASIRKGDVIGLIGANGVSVGNFSVAFVKDKEDREVVSTAEDSSDVLYRSDGTGIINSIEIIATAQQFLDISKRATDIVVDDKTVYKGEDFTIVQVVGEDRENAFRVLDKPDIKEDK